MSLRQTVSSVAVAASIKSIERTNADALSRQLLPLLMSGANGGDDPTALDAVTTTVQQSLRSFVVQEQGTTQTMRNIRARACHVEISSESMLGMAADAVAADVVDAWRARQQARQRQRYVVPDVPQVLVVDPVDPLAPGPALTPPAPPPPVAAARPPPPPAPPLVDAPLLLSGAPPDPLLASLFLVNRPASFSVVLPVILLLVLLLSMQ